MHTAGGHPGVAGPLARSAERLSASSRCGRLSDGPPLTSSPPEATSRDMKTAEAIADAFRLPRPPRAVVFDLDGTLIDSEALVFEAYMAAAERHGLPLDQSRFLACVGKHRAATEATLRSYFGDFPLEVFFETVSAHIGDGVAPLKPGALEILDRLDASKLRYALATSSGPPWVARHFSAHAFDARFHAVVTRNDVTNGKPHPEPYLKAAAALGFDPGEVLAVEDSPTGLAAAHAAGLMTVMIPDLLQPTDVCRTRATVIAGSLHDVLPLLD